MVGPVVLITDFGLRDPYVGVMKGVIKSINPGAEIIDLTHNVRKFDINAAAVILFVSAKYFPKGTIFTCVVDPGVGSSRRAILIVTRNYYLVGPDNGCLSLLAKEDGVIGVYDVSESPFRLPEVSGTFHGRDIFAPIAAWLSRGIKPEQLGRPINEYVEIDIPAPMIRGNSVEGRIIYIDHFGNIMSNIKKELVEKIGVKIGDKINVILGSRGFECPYVRSFSNVPEGEVACYINSWGYFEIGINKSSAADILKVETGEKVKIYK